MKLDLRQADERFEVVCAAEAWHGAGALDDTGLESIRARYRDDRRRTKPAFRALFFLFTMVAGLALWGFLIALLDVRLFDSSGGKRHALLLGLLATAATWSGRHAIERLRLRRFGIEEGLVALAIGFETGALALSLETVGVPATGIGFAVGCNLAAIATAVAWRWGIPGSGALAALGLFGALALMPSARLLWILCALPLIALAFRISRLEGVALAHRRRAEELFLVATVALYLAVHVSIAAARWFHAWAEDVADPTGLEGWARCAGWGAMTAMPLALLALGARERDRLLLSLGALGLLATAASFVHALDLGPLWLGLLGGGAGLIALALVSRRFLSLRPDRTVAGFTDEPLYEPAASRNLLEIAATLALLTPDARLAEERPGFRAGGGEFGGGGASTDF